MKHYKDFESKPNNDTEGFIKVLHTLERVFDANVHDIDDFNTYHVLHHVDYAWLVNATYFLNPYLQARYGFTYDVVIKHGITADNYYVSFVPNKEQ